MQARQLFTFPFFAVVYLTIYRIYSFFFYVRKNVYETIILSNLIVLQNKKKNII